MPREDFGKRLPFDPRMLEKIDRSSTMRAEQGAEFLQDWGGSAGYQRVAQLHPSTREVYFAVIEGGMTPEQLEVMTGLSKAEVARGRSELLREGLITEEDVVVE